MGVKTGASGFRLDLVGVGVDLVAEAWLEGPPLRLPASEFFLDASGVRLVEAFRWSTCILEGPPAGGDDSTDSEEDLGGGGGWP